MFLTRFDFYGQARPYVLDDIVNNHYAFYSADNEAKAKVESYLNARYDTDAIFIELLHYSPSATFQVGSYVYYEPVPFNTSTAYTVGQLVEYNYQLYQCTADSTGNAVDNTDFFSSFNGLPIFKATATSTANLPTNRNFFNQQDDRYPLVVNYCRTVALYELYATLEPNQIDESRQERFDQVIDELKMIAKQVMNPKLPVPEDGSKEEILYNSAQRRCNRFE